MPAAPAPGREQRSWPGEAAYIRTKKPTPSRNEVLVYPSRVGLRWNVLRGKIYLRLWKCRFHNPRRIWRRFGEERGENEHSMRFAFRDPAKVVGRSARNLYLNLSPPTGKGPSVAKVSIYARADKRDRTGAVPLFLRIAHKDGTRYVSLGLRVKSRHWNGSAQQVRKSNPDHAQLNTYLAATTAEAQRAVADLLASGEKVTALAIKLQLKAKGDGEKDGQDDFIAYCEARLEDYHRRGQISTWKAYRTATRKLRDYTRRELGRSDLPFGSVTLPFMRGLQTYMIDDLGNAPNTVHKSMASIHTMLGGQSRRGCSRGRRIPSTTSRSARSARTRRSSHSKRSGRSRRLS